MQNLPEVYLRIKRGLKKIKALRDQRKIIGGQIMWWEEELTRLRERESELECERAEEELHKAGIIEGDAA
jgi:hypothetical protein